MLDYHVGLVLLLLLLLLLRRSFYSVLSTLIHILNIKFR
jgi:hypothetical protein